VYSAAPFEPAETCATLGEPLKRVLAFAALAAILASAASATAAFQPIRRTFGERELPRLRAGRIVVPAAHRSGRITVIVTLRQPPLAAWHRDLYGPSARARLSVSSADSRAYMRELATAQAAAVRQLKAAVPGASVTRRFRILLNGFAATVPAKSLPTVVRLSSAAHVYPSLRYAVALDRSPALVGATALRSAARAGEADGSGVKIAVVDDGVDQTSAFFAPAGYSYPPGFPKGGTKWTTPKVIVARSFVGAVQDHESHLAVDPASSFHGTHVAGIAAGNAGTNAPAGADHPATSGLSGVAPRAWIGNYRVFNAPTPVGHVANTPEIVAAFESAVRDGMDVINFSGGGPETEPQNDAMIQTVHNVTAAGVVAVISAGNDRDDYGLGSVGSPGTAPDAISVAALSNDHVFAGGLDVVTAGAPATLHGVPFQGALAQKAPADWGTSDQTLVDVGSIVGTDGKPVDRLLCGGGGANVDAGPGTLPAGSLRGSIALARRGVCTLASKAERARAAGATGLILIDNRSGEANIIPVQLGVPSGMVADLDGNRLEAFLAAHGGRTGIRVGDDVQELQTGRGSVVTSFSSGGLTPFGHQLKPDLGAPGGQILSSTLKQAGGPFAVFDGTSMAAPHVTGAAAILVQRHPGWTPEQIRSALVSTAASAWADTAQTAEAPVLLAGGGAANVAAADSPLVFTQPSSLSFGDLNVTRGAAETPLLLAVSDAGDGGGNWTVSVRPQSNPAGVSLELPGVVSVAPGGRIHVPIVAHAAADASPGDAYGFVVLQRGSVTRRVPYAFLVTKPALAGAPVLKLKRVQSGTTKTGANRASVYRYPAAPFGPAPDYVGAPVREDGADKLYAMRVNDAVVNAGVAIIAQSRGSLVHPWLLGSPDENDVQGYAGTPSNVNALTFDYQLDVGAAALVTPRVGTYYVAVDSGRDIFSGRSLAGNYVLWSWQNDVLPPLQGLLTARVAAGRPTLALRVIDVGANLFDPGAGVDPLSLVLSYGNVLVGAAAYDPASGIALFPLPQGAPTLRTGDRSLVSAASDFQESKNLNTTGANVMPNTSFASGTLKVVNGPAATWLVPETRECLAARADLVVLASSTTAIRSVRFLDGRKQIAVDRTGPAGLYTAVWRAGGATKGEHTLRAIVRDAKGRAYETKRVVRRCS
jgi:minor extracellular serine protease Vpr